jgi:hypothetical protein
MFHRHSEGHFLECRYAERHILYSNAKCRYGECRHAECRGAFETGSPRAFNCLVLSVFVQSD